MEDPQQTQPIDAKRLIIAMSLAMAVFIGWQFGITWLYKTMGWQLPSQRQQTAATQPAPATTQTAVLTTAPSTQQLVATTGPTSAPATGVRAVLSEKPENAKKQRLGSDTFADKKYAMLLSLNPRGAGIDGVVLNDFKRSVKDQRTYVFQEPYAGYEARSRPLATRSISVNGEQFNLDDVDWKLAEDQDPKAATYSIALSTSAGALEVRKTYHVFERNSSERKGSAGYEVAVDYSFKNLGTADLKVKTVFNGPTLPPTEISRGPDRQVVGGYKEGSRVAVHAHPVESFKPDEAPKDLTKDSDGQPVIWAGAASVYFEALVLPEVSHEAPLSVIQSVRAEGLDIKKDNDPAHHQVATVFETQELAVPAGGEVKLPLSAYFGPKWRKVLSDPYYAAFPRAYNQTLVIASGMCAICTFGWLIDALVWMLNAFHYVALGDWGVAIILLVILVRTLLHPITKRSQISMVKMGKMGPQMEALKKKYGDDKEALSKAMWEFQKSQGVTPILGCAPMFLQMPIWIALWSALQTTFELRQSPFLWGFTWIKDLAKPDSLVTFNEPIHLFWGITIGGINLLPILLAAVFWVQQKMTPKPAATTPEQEQQQKMMQWMSLLFPVFLYNGPAGLNLYIMTSTGIGIIESKIIRDHIKQREEAEKEGRVIVDAPPTRGSKRREREPATEPKKKGLFGVLADLQARAEEMRREAQRKGK